LRLPCAACLCPEECTALEGELDTAKEQISASEREAQVAAADARRIQGEAARRDVLNAPAEAVAARDSAVIAVEQQVEATSIGEGILDGRA
jgi:hypothetical protein